MNAHVAPQLRCTFLLCGRQFVGRESQCRWVTISDLSEMVTFDLGLGHPIMNKSRTTGFWTGNNKGEDSCGNELDYF